MCVPNNTARRINFKLDHKNFSNIPADTVFSNSIIKTPIPTSSENFDRNSLRHVIDHTYHDYSHEIDDHMAMIDDPRRKHKGGVAIPFPFKLHQLLEDTEKHGHESIISWSPHGRSFVVHKPKEFVAEILPTYFKQSKIGSFQRQLNLYGFRRFTGGKDKGGYYHEYFLRGMSFLVHRMRRTKVKGTLVRGASSPETEPNFYAMPWVTTIKQENDSNSNSGPDAICKDGLLKFEGKPFYYISNLRDRSIRDINSSYQDAETDLFDREFLSSIDLPFELDSSLDLMDDNELGCLLERLTE